ncbi:MAG: tRNA guanosine(34) transglycosylase Tgt [Candidatus Magasanikbacteria bacterium]|nr:tRNA guanosine(34) transglycosylase Tgt [Candidatus Magasanikbacteria bacterium]
MSDFFELQHQSKKSGARLGVIHTAHGDVATPVFMPVGTQATVKTLDPRDLQEIKATIILGNAYHLHLRPGEILIKKMGGLAAFMNWPGPTLTDSGGFQVFSLDKTFEVRGQTNKKNMAGKQLVKITEEGVAFRSYIDGSRHIFTPESAIDIQHKIGADIIMVFDQCTRDNASKEESRQAMERTHEWAKRCADYHQNQKPMHSYPQHLFGIIQGGRFKDLRIKSAKVITALPFDGIAIGGESIGFNMPATEKIMGWLKPLLPEDKPRYAMGVGFAPSDLFNAVAMGIDMFDCVAPTRLARNGALYISPAAGGSAKNKYRLNINNAEFRSDAKPIDPWCDCVVCRGFEDRKFFSRAYLRHLFKAEELLPLRLASLHNIRFMLKIMEEIRNAIAADSFEKLKKEWRA